MTDEQRAALKRWMEERTEAVSKDPAASRASLVKDGIITEDGQLAPEYQVERDREPTDV